MKKANKFNEGKETMVNMEAIRCCKIKSTRSFKIIRFIENVKMICARDFNLSGTEQMEIEFKNLHQIINSTRK